MGRKGTLGRLGCQNPWECSREDGMIGVIKNWELKFGKLFFSRDFCFVSGGVLLFEDNIYSYQVIQ